MDIFKTLKKQTQFVADHSKYVKIDPQKLAEFTDQLDLNQKVANWLDPAFGMPGNLTLEQALMFAFIYEMTNFCLWPEPQWHKIVKGKKLNGSLSLIACYAEALAQGIDILDPDTLIHFSLEDYKKLLKTQSACELCLIPERLAFLQQAMQVLKEKYNGSMLVFIQKYGFDGQRILKAIIDEFPSFDDVQMYHNQQVPFYKRAQMAVEDLDFVYQKHTGRAFTHMDDICIGTDYNVPQILRHAGVLVYAPSLAEWVDEGRQIPYDDDREIEIRANAFAAVDQIKELHNRRHPDDPRSSKEVDDIIWMLAQNDWQESEPFHKTVTWFY